MKDKTRILVVEDESIVAEDIKVRLELLGYKVAGLARSANNALSLTEKERPDLVLMDIKLEGEMDGIQAADIIRKRWHLPVIFLTAYSEDATISTAKLTEPFGYLIKPFEDRELKTTIEMGLYKHKMEEVLQESETKYRMLFENATDAIFLLDLTVENPGKIISANQAAADMHGYTINELLAMNITDLDTPDAAKEAPEKIRRILNGEKMKAVITHRKKDGSVFPVEISAGLLEIGSHKYILAFDRDITERRRVEEALQESERRNRHAQKISGLGYWEWNIVAGELYWSDLVYSHYGVDPKSFRPSFDAVIEMIHPEDRDCLMKAVQATLNDNAEYNVVARVMRPDGKVCYVHNIAEVTRDAQGKPIKLVGTQLDITKIKEAQEERIQLIEREHEARAEAQAARKLDRMKSMFIAATSHELRTPLNSIIGFTSLILDGASGELNPDQKQQLTLVHSSGKHLLALINDIIDLSMIESGRIKVVVCEFSLRKVVDEAASNINVILNEKKLELKVDVKDIKMRSDRKRLLQCIINLVSNAIKYTEKGSVVITSRVIDNNVEISVIDTGIGIKPEDIPKLFGPFVRLQSPLTFKTSGTGLGLYLVKKLARDFLGGDVEVKSEFGKGSAFTLCVPIELEGRL